MMSNKGNKRKQGSIIGAIAGDVIGSVYEWNNQKTTKIDLFSKDATFTDDTVLTIAVADAILNGKDFASAIWDYGNRYPGRGYGGRFGEWLQSSEKRPYYSFGNGSAMRVSAVGYAYNTLEEVLEVAKQTAGVTHNHPQGILGAQAIAVAVFMARHDASQKDIKRYISSEIGYNIDFSIDEIRPTYRFDVTCQGSVPQAIVSFLESVDFESAIRLAISVGGDSDTIACMTGAVAAAFYKEIPGSILDFVYDKLPYEFIEIIRKFDDQYLNF